MFLLALPSACTYICFVIAIAFALIRLGHRFLDLLRDLDDYRGGRHR